MGVAEPMSDVEGKVGCPTVVDEATPKRGRRPKSERAIPHRFSWTPYEVSSVVERTWSQERDESTRAPDSSSWARGDLRISYSRTSENPSSALSISIKVFWMVAGQARAPKRSWYICEERSKGRIWTEWI